MRQDKASQPVLKRRWFRAVAAFVLSVIAELGLLILAASTISTRWILHTFRPYVWYIGGYAIIAYLAAALGMGLVLAILAWHSLSTVDVKRKIKRRFLVCAGTLAVALLALFIVGIALKPVGGAHLLLQHRAGRRDFSGLDLHGIYLARANLPRIDLRGADLRQAELSGADLCNSDLRGANLKSTGLAGAHLAGADLEEATLSDTELEFADLTDTDLSRIDLTTTDLAGADLIRANLSGANLVGTNLDFANLTGAVLDNATRLEPRWYLVWELVNKDNSHRNLSRLDLSRCDLTGARLVSANLESANLAHATLSRADLTGANLHGADLTEASLYDTILRNANLRDAGLTGAYMTNADISHADLRGARMYGTWLTDEQLATAKSLLGAILPDGTISGGPDEIAP